MFSRFILFSLATAILAFATPMTEEEKALNDFRAAGMSENGINAMVNLENKFKAEFPLVAGNQESTDKFLAAFAAHTQDVVNTLSKEDQAIYNNSGNFWTECRQNWHYAAQNGMDAQW